MQLQKVVVLRWGHRPQRDVRLTTHVALTSRALGASGFILSDVVDEHLKLTVEKIAAQWGGDFSFSTFLWEKILALTATLTNIPISHAS